MNYLVENNQLFKKSFDVAIWQNKDKIDYLKRVISDVERTIEEYLSKITVDFPQLTDHSLKHSRMLWNYSNIIIGESRNFLNPLEGFILHLTFLIHDSGMCYSILNNLDEIKADPLFLDYIKQNGESEIATKDALFYVVRSRHGDYAQKVATERLISGEYLIKDTNLREELGLMIGKISKSHSCNTNYIEREFGTRYCSPSFPTDWSVDCQKLSFILRTADAAHLDNLRTPKSNKLISEIDGISKDHWTFQKKLGFPVLSKDNLLTYTSNNPFSEKEQKAWWICYDALTVLDREIKSANEFFETKNQIPFEAKGVKSISDTLELGKEYIRTEGWVSVDSTIKVTNPVHIATELGGIKLYGNIHFALRELIQNSIDAINLHRVYTDQDNVNVGEINISLEKENDDFFLIVTDNGIGMSQTILTNELLDFGGSYWKNDKFAREFEGINYKGFESIGQFGIGFFSVFMLGKFINVTSWKFGESISNMKTLDFYDGINSNPILRKPTQKERYSIIDRGTSVKIELYDDPYSKVGLVGNSSFSNNLLFTLIKFLAPSSNVKINIKEIDGTLNTILPNHLFALNFCELLDFLYLKRDTQSFDALIDNYKNVDIKLIEIKKDDFSYGKLALLPVINNTEISVAVNLSKGIRVSEISGFAGYINTNEIISIKRDFSSKVLTYESLKIWAIAQKTMIESLKLFNIYHRRYWGLLMTFNLHDDSLPIFLKKKNNQYEIITITSFIRYLKSYAELEIYKEGHTMVGRLPDCDGFIDLNYGFSVDAIIKEEDIPKLLKQKDLIEQIIKNEWPSFEYSQNNFINEEFRIDMPYLHVKTYKKLPIIIN